MTLLGPQSYSLLRVGGRLEAPLEVVGSVLGWGAGDQLAGSRAVPSGLRASGPSVRCCARMQEPETAETWHYGVVAQWWAEDRKSTRLNSSH